MNLPTNLHIGTSSWATDDWVGHFYPAGTHPAEYLAEYAKHYSTVEIDSTWYRAPSARMVEGWRDKSPPGFIFSAKVPRSITHERALIGCEEEMSAFLKTMDRLGEKLGPLLLQFEYVAKARDAEEYRTGAAFLGRLKPFLEQLPSHYRFVVEVRNETWLRPELFELLRAHRVALALTAYFTMPPVNRFRAQADLDSAHFRYLRFLGHHRQMDQTVANLIKEGKREKAWEGLAVDRTRDMEQWVPVIRELLQRQVPAYAYFNNHYAGYAPGSIDLFLSVWKRTQPGG